MTIGTMELPNRLVMAPTSSVRAGPDGLPSDIMVEHYRQHASMRLIISDGIELPCVSSPVRASRAG